MWATPTIRLSAWKIQACEIFTRPSWRVGDEEILPAVLLSYAGRRVWLRKIEQMKMRNYVLDSGAFSAHSKGVPIDVHEFRDAVMAYRDNGILPVEIFSLDVIGNRAESKKNTEWLWTQGIRVIPVFHYGEPEDLLLGYAQDYPKVALGGAVGLPRKEKERWAKHCFAKIWPKPIHGLGFVIWAMEVLPFHSIDSADWEAGCSRYGHWSSFKRLNLGLHKQDIYDNMGLEAQFWLEAERVAKRRWASTFTALHWDEDHFKPFTEGAI